MTIAPTIARITKLTSLPEAQIYAATGLYVQSHRPVGQVAFLHRQPAQPKVDPRGGPTPQDFVDNARGYLTSFQALLTGDNNDEVKYGIDPHGYMESASFAVRGDKDGKVDDVFAVHPQNTGKRVRVSYTPQHNSYCAADTYFSTVGKDYVIHSSTVYADADGKVRDFEVPSLTSQPHNGLSSHVSLQRLEAVVAARRNSESDTARALAAAATTQNRDSVTNAIMYVGAYFMSSLPVDGTRISMAVWRGTFSESTAPRSLADITNSNIRLESTDLVWKDGDFFTSDGKRWSDVVSDGVLGNLTILRRGEKDIDISSGFTKPDGKIHIVELTQFGSEYLFSGLSQEISQNMRGVKIEDDE